MKKKYFILFLSLCVIGIVFSIIFSITVGAVSIPFGKTVDTLINFFLSNPLNDDPTTNIIINFRFPRAIMAVLIGAGLSLGGVIMQAVTKNNLADPYILGISSGASAGAVIAIVLDVISVYTGAFVGALVACALVFMLFSFDKDKTVTKIVLIGVAVSALFNAINTYVITTAKNAEKVRNATFWSMGSLGGATWKAIPPILIVLIIIVLISLSFNRELDGLALGDDDASMLGYPVNKIRKIAMILISLLTAVIVAKTGIIGFVGLVVPHIARKISGYAHKYLIPVSLVIGSLLLLWADTISRILIRPEEMPIGVITAFIGVPFFLWIMRQKGRNYDRN